MTLRDDDSSAPANLAFALFLSALAHTAFFAALIGFSMWGPSRKVIVPGYKVDLVTLSPSSPASLLPPGPLSKPGGPETPKPAEPEKPKPAEPEKPKPAEPEKPKPAAERPMPEPKVKPAPPPVKKSKAEPVVKDKTAEAPKKIMAKSDDVPKKEIRKDDESEKKAEEPEPQKTKTLPPIETASIPSGQSSTSTPRPSRSGGGGGGGLVTEGMAFPHTWYLQIIERKANENWITHGIIISGKRADPVVRFNILRNGKVDGLDLEKSSGNPTLDESALAAITRASPFPQLPADYGSDHLTVHFSFTYEQRD